MHGASATFVANAIERHLLEHGPFTSVLEVGARDINGTVRSLFGPCEYVGMDVHDGPGVDLVWDATVPWPERWPGFEFDCVVCTNVLEHVNCWERVIVNAREALAPGGWLIVTAPSDPFPSHSCIDGEALRPGEHYANVAPLDLANVMAGAGLAIESIFGIPPDTGVVGIWRP